MKKKSSYVTFKKALMLALCIFLLCLSAACRTEKDADRSTPPGDMAGTDYDSRTDSFKKDSTTDGTDHTSVSDTTIPYDNDATTDTFYNDSLSDPSYGVITDIGDAARDGAEEIRDGLHDLTQDNVPGTVETQRR